MGLSAQRFPSQTRKSLKAEQLDGCAPSPYIASSDFDPDLRLFFPSLFQASHLLSPVKATVSVCLCVMVLIPTIPVSCLHLLRLPWPPRWDWQSVLPTPQSQAAFSSLLYRLFYIRLLPSRQCVSVDIHWINTLLRKCRAHQS